MELDLEPRFSKKIFGGDGGEYYIWSSKDFPLIAETKVGGGRLVIEPLGFALPHYADCSKIGYVLQGNNGLAGMVFPNTAKEVVLKLREGDIIPVPFGALSWWYNGEGDSDLVIVYLGITEKAHIQGEFSYLFQAGGIGILAGFSNDFVSRIYGLSEEEADKLANSQTGVMIIALSPEKALNLKPSDTTCAKNQLVYNIDDAYPDYKAKKDGGFWTKVSQTKFPFLGEVGLSANHIELGPGSISLPIYTTDSSAQLIYFVRGHGHIQIVGIQGKRVLDSDVKAGHLVIVPRFFVVAAVAGELGLECLSVITSSEPVLEDMASKESTLAALSPEALAISLNVSADFAMLFMSKIKERNFILPLEQRS